MSLSQWSCAASEVNTIGACERGERQTHTTITYNTTASKDAIIDVKLLYRQAAAVLLCPITKSVTRSMKSLGPVTGKHPREGLMARRPR